MTAAVGLMTEVNEATDMATILLVDDRPANREYLAMLLGSSGYRVVEASDGDEALACTRQLHPDLVIADILMPRVDGCEFVRRLRSETPISRTPVIFLSAHYAEHEIRALAASCEVSQILTKPIEPDRILASVSQALGQGGSSGDRPQQLEQFNQDHLRLLTDKLARKADQLEVANHRLRSLVDLGRQLGAERDPRHLLSNFCEAATELHDARHALIVIVDEQGGDVQHIVACAENSAEVDRVNSPGTAEALIRRFIATDKAVLISGATHQPHGGLPEELASLCPLLVAPIHTSTSRYGLLCVGCLSDIEQADASLLKLATSMASVLGIAYENAIRYEKIDRHAARLQQEVAERTVAQNEVQRLNAELEQRVAERTAELEASHQRLRQSERMAAMGTFSAGLGHDIMNMLLPIRANIDTLKPELTEEEYQKRIDNIRHCVDYLHSLTRGLRLLARDPDGERQDATTDLDEWKESTYPLLKCMISHNMSLHWHCPPQLPPLKIESHRLTQALFNLVKNSVDALKEHRHGEISVSIDHSDSAGMVRIEVADNGPGMSDDVRARAVDPFYTTKTREFSTGLGLSMVYTIVEGNLTLDSTAGEGTCARIEIPIAGHNAEAWANDDDPAAIDAISPQPIPVHKAEDVALPDTPSARSKPA